ncbi:MAG: polymer-forming cytoskeletal protein [Planctomycetota bacterium]
MSEHTNGLAHGEEMTVIGPDTHIKGEMHFDGTARILGSFEGRISAKGEVQIGLGAVCKAAVEGSMVIVDGSVEGDVQARESVHLNERASVKGDIAAPRMVVADGASFIGHCRIGAEFGEPTTGERQAPAPMIHRENGHASAFVEPRPNGSSAKERVESARAKLADAQARLARFEQRDAEPVREAG